MLGFGKSTADKMLASLYTAGSSALVPAPPSEPVVVDSAPEIEASFTQRENAAWQFEYHDGNTFEGGYGPTVSLLVDYWALRQKSGELFARNRRARGIILRMVDNVIGTGLALESEPVESVLGQEEGALDDWVDEVEARWDLWASCKGCDAKNSKSFGQLQYAAYLEALIAGDVLVVLIQDPITLSPRIHLVGGDHVTTPLSAQTPNIRHGVELDAEGQHVAYWILQQDGTHKRLPAYGANSGRRQAWLLYGTRNRLDDVRGQPFLSAMLQALKELDRYTDASLRKAVISSMLALFVTKQQEGVGSRPLTGAAVRHGVRRSEPSDNINEPFAYQSQTLMPGLVIDRLATGEDIKAMGNAGVDDKLSEFEEAVVSTMAWSNGMPPEILRLSFGSNYAASQAALNEFRVLLDNIRTEFGRDFCQPVYCEWFVSETLGQRIQSPGFLDAYRDPSMDAQYIYQAWTMSDWSGHVKPTTDMVKQARGLGMLLDLGLTNFTRASREATGTTFRKNLKRQKREREQAAEAGIPLSVRGGGETGEGVFTDEREDGTGTGGSGGSTRSDENENEQEQNDVAE